MALNVVYPGLQFWGNGMRMQPLSRTTILLQSQLWCVLTGSHKWCRYIVEAGATEQHVPKFPEAFNISSTLYNAG